MMKLHFIFILMALLSIKAPVFSAESPQPIQTAAAVYLQGYEACLAANRLRYSNLALAQQNYQFYLARLNRANELDPQFSYTQDSELKSNLSYCHKVSKNLVSARAQSFMTKSLTACFAAQRAANDHAMSQASQLWGSYQEQKKAAVKLNAAIIKNDAMAHRIQQCDQIEKTIAAVEQNAQQFLQQQKAATHFFVEAAQSCLSAKMILNDARFKAADAAIVIHALGMSQRLAQQGQDTLDKIPEGAMDTDQIKQAQQRQLTQERCIEEITTRLKTPLSSSAPRSAIPMQRDSVAQLTRTIQMAVELCLTAQTLRSTATDDVVLREKAGHLFEESSRVFISAQKKLRWARQQGNSTQALEKLAMHYTQCAESIRAEDTRSAER